MANEIYSLYRTYRDTQNSITTLQNGSGEPEPNPYALLETDIRQFLGGRWGAILKNIRELYADITEERGGRLFVTGTAMPAAPFNRENCAKLREKLGELLASSVRELSQTNRHAPHARELVAKVYFCRNVLVDIADFCHAEAQKDQALAAEQKRARLSQLTETAKRQGTELLSLGKRSCGDILLTPSTRITDTLRESLVLPLGHTPVKVEQTNLSIPVLWDLSKQGIVFVEAKEAELEDGGLEALIENTVMHFLAGYPGASKRVLVCDRCCSAELISFVTTLSGGKGCAPLFSDGNASGECPVYTSQESAARALSALKINQRIATTGGHIFAYNQNNPENIQPPVLVVLRGFGGSLNYSGSELFHTLLQNGSKAGIFFLVIDTPEGAAILPKTVTPERYTYHARLRAIGDGQDVFSVNLRDGDFSVSDFARTLTESVASSVTAIDFSTLHRDRGGQDFAASLVVPIGKEGERTVVMELSSKSTAAHGVLTGMTGSGKSSLLHDIILGLAETYTPAELELWLFDFKVGVEFAPYEKLKHVRRMALNNKSRDAADLMNDVLRQMVNRNQIIRSVGANDIVAYNNKMRQSGGTLMSRLLVIIDEYTAMKNLKCIADFELVALQGRSAGISFIMSSQIHDSMFKRITDQADHKFEFRNKTVGVLIPACTERDNAFLTQLPGNCIYHDGTTLHRMRAAYVGGEDDAVSRKITEINQKHAEFPYEKPMIVGSASAIGQRKTADDDSEVRRIYRKTKQIPIPIGRSRDGEEVSFCLGKDHSHMLLLGDEARCADVEYAMGSRVAMLDGEPNVCYLDFYQSADRTPNIIADGDAAPFPYLSVNREIGAAVQELYARYIRRMEALENGDPVGGPQLLMIHGTEYLPERAKRITKLLEGEGQAQKQAPQASPFLSLDEEAELILAGLGSVEEDQPQNEDTAERDVWKMLCSIVSDGSRVRIYTSLHFENAKEARGVTDRLFTHRRSLSDSVILPALAPHQKTVSTKYVTEYLSAVGVSTADFDKESEINASELLYGYLVSGSDAARFIPYENEIE